MVSLSSLSLGRVVVFFTVITIVSFLALLIVTNAMNRRGITELQKYDADISDYTRTLKIVDYDIATYSSLLRVEQRAQEMGFRPTKKIEYIK
jgi:cell division protein FtsL